MSRAPSSVGLLLALSIMACDGDEPRLERAAVALPCDISRTRCQRTVFALTARVRGQANAKLPAMRTISRAQLRDELDEWLSQDGEPDPTAQAIERAYALLGVLPAVAGGGDAALGADLAEGIAAYYSPGDQLVTIISDSAMSADDGTFVLAHEFVHALQHQRGDLSSPESAATTDGRVAFDSLIEGEAVWLSNLTYNEAVAADPPDHDRVELYFANMREGILAEIAESLAPLYLAGEVLPYPLGGHGVFLAHEASGLSAIEALHDDPPDNVGFWLGGRRNFGEPTRCGLPAPPADWELLGTDRLGVVGVVALEAASTGAPELTLAAAWQHDEVGVYASPDRRQVAIVWRIRFDSAAAAQQLVTLSAEGGRDVEVLSTGEEVTIVGLSDPQLRDGWSSLEGCPTRTPESSPREARAMLASRYRRLPIVR